VENHRKRSVRNWKTRIAPTPSGYLHLGNVYSFSVTAAFAHVTGAQTLLRIDDLDTKRVRDEYIADIFQTLDYLKIPFSGGPRNGPEFIDAFSQLTRLHLYNDALQKLADQGVLFACTCSRMELARLGGAGYNGTCRTKNIPLDTKGACWRIVTDDDTPLVLHSPAGNEELTLPVEMKDFIVRKKDGSPAYQLSSLIDDTFYGIDLVIRGQDLLSSTLAQLYLARSLDLGKFGETVFYHHKLLCTPSGDKLSKSAGDTSVHLLRKNGATPETVYNLVGKLSSISPLNKWEDLIPNVKDLYGGPNGRGKYKAP
jgi:glutamyl/glutaminyl-tRNA synthetase